MRVPPSLFLNASQNKRGHSTASSSILFNPGFSNTVPFSTGVNTKNPFSPTSLETLESLDELPRCSLGNTAAKILSVPNFGDLDADGGPDSLADVGVSAKNPFNPWRRGICDSDIFPVLYRGQRLEGRWIIILDSGLGAEGTHLYKQLTFGVVFACDLVFRITGVPKVSWKSISSESPRKWRLGVRVANWSVMHGWFRSDFACEIIGEGSIRDKPRFSVFFVKMASIDAIS
jgi:hypothetical protein